MSADEPLAFAYEGCVERRELDGAAVPWRYGPSVDDELRVVREGVALALAPHAWLLRVYGDDALAALERVVARDVHLREGQLRQAVVLTERAEVLADVYVGLDEDSYLLAGEGCRCELVCALLCDAVRPGEDVRVEALLASHALVQLTGPFAWDLLAALEGPDVLGFPYLSLYRPQPGALLFRAGKTGEYGYDLWLPREALAGWWERLCTEGAAFDLRVVGHDALWLAGLENNFFNAYEQRAPGLTPIELQQQWRVSYRKSYHGSAALFARRAEGPRERVVAVASEAPLARGMAVRFEDEPLGELLVARRSPSTGLHLGLARLAVARAYSGVDVYRAVDAAGASHPLRTYSPPSVNNRSLYVKPQEHSYAQRGELAFAPLSRLR